MEKHIGIISDNGVITEFDFHVAVETLVPTWMQKKMIISLFFFKSRKNELDRKVEKFSKWLFFFSPLRAF